MCAYVKLSFLVGVLGFSICLSHLCFASNGNSCFCVQQLLTHLKSPVHIESTKLNNHQVYIIAEQSGMILQYRKDSDKPPSVYINLTDRVFTENTMYEENGLLAFALHPDFVTNKKMYIYSIRTVDSLNYAVVSEVEDQNIDQEKILLLVEQPGSLRNGGQVLFGEDGYLYVFVGDGGPGPHGDIESQNGDSLLGKVLRLDVSKTVVRNNQLRYYDIPGDNPKRADWKPEIFAIGVRNMWRCSVDKGDKSGQGKGRIFCGDLGSNIADEISLVQKGANYGWPEREGLTCLQEADCKNISGEVLPIYAFNRSSSDMNALVTGPIYRANWFPEIRGHLLLGDFVTGNIERLVPGTDRGLGLHNFSICNIDECPCNHRNQLRSHLLSIGEDEEGEILLLMTDEVHPFRPRGGLLQLVPPSKTTITCSGPEIFPRASQTVVSLLVVLGVVLL